MTQAQKRLLSGVKPTGRPHIGNYFGAIKQFVDLQDEYEAFVFVADLHALTTNHSQQNPEEVRAAIYDVARTYLAAGLDPEKVTLFQQSQVHEHTELTWVFDCLTTMPYLMRAHAFKDAEAKNKEISVGTFNYPMLMAADILMYDPHVVPVGKDQQQHVEYARDTAQKFNNTYGETFNTPEHLIIEGVATVPGTDGQKMSKSYNNTIPLFGTREEIEKAVMGIPAGSGMTQEEALNLSRSKNEPVIRDSIGPVRNLLAIHELFNTEDDLIELYIENSENYRLLKQRLVEDIERFIAPMRERYESITDEEIVEILNKGSMRAKEIASAKMEDVRKKIGITL